MHSVWLLTGAYVLAGSVFVFCVAVIRIRAGRSEFRAVAVWAVAALALELLMRMPVLLGMAPLARRAALIVTGALIIPWALYGVIRVVPMLGRPGTGGTAKR